MNKSKLSPNLIVIYAKDVAISEQFYRDVLQKEPIVNYNDFVLFELINGFQLGIQAADEILPKHNGSNGGFEICIDDVSSDDDVDYVVSRWKAKGYPFLLEPQRLEFGYTAVIADPDGHRVRVCATDTTGIEEK